VGITIGDALTVVSVFAALGFSIWACSILATLLAKDRVTRAKDRLVAAPGRSMFAGVLFGVLWTALFMTILGIPNPITKIIGIIGLGCLGSLAAVGLGGIATLVAERIGEVDPQFGSFAGLVRGATLVVLATITPLIGWFFLGPIALFASIGAGLHTVVSRHHERAVSPAESSNGGL
jgi:hypothetical protein